MASLFQYVRGRRSVEAAIEGQLVDGRTFRAPLPLTLVGTGRETRSAFAPNPLQTAGGLIVSTNVPGRLKVSIFAASGRLERVIADVAMAPVGPHSFAFDGTRPDGTKLASGVYFYRIESADGTRTGKFVIAK
jgi:hypothetical protein